MTHLYYQTFTNWLHLHPEWGGIAAFFIAFAESVAILGTIVPGSVTMTAIGILVGSGVIPLYSTVSLAIAGAIMGDVLSYFAGYFLKDGIKKIWPFRTHPQWLERATEFFSLHGGKSVFFGRFIGPVRAMIPIIAGTLAMRPIRFFIIDFLAAALWAPLYLLPGYLVGVAATTLPTKVATELILGLLAILILITFLLWLANKTSSYLNEKINSLLNAIWRVLCQSPRWRWICRLLRDANHPQDHGQLLLSFACLLTLIFFLLVFLNTIYADPFRPIDNFFYHFFRGFRFTPLDKAIVFVSSISTLFTLFIAEGIIVFYLLFKRHFWAAFHLLLASFLALGLAILFQNLYYVHRPEGVQLILNSSSFPSSQVSFSCAFYGFLAWLICLDKRKWKKIVYAYAAIFMLLAMLSHIYLGFHWFSDAMGSFFLGAACATLIAISYQRKLSTAPKALPLVLVSLLAIAIGFTIDVRTNAQRLLMNSTPVWNQHLLDKTIWWGRQTEIIPLYRTTRLGTPAELFNLQWAGSLPVIRQELLASGWIEVKHNFTEVMLNQLQANNKMMHITILPVLYADQRPVLEMVKLFNHNSTPLMIRLWSANVTLTPDNLPLWIGTLNYIHPYGKTGWLTHSYHLISELNAIPILLNSLPANQWIITLRYSNTLPVNLVPTPQAPHYAILIQPQ